MESRFDGKVEKLQFATLTLVREQIWNLLEDTTLCDGFDPERQKYSRPAHLAQLIGLLGDIPKALLDRGKDTSRWFESDGESHGQSYSVHLLTVHQAHSSVKTLSHRMSIWQIRLSAWKVKIRGFSLSLLVRCCSGFRRKGVQPRSCSGTLGFIGSFDCYVAG
jgi:hypothetical protein